MSWNEFEDGIGHDGLAPPSKAQQRRNAAIEADITALKSIAHRMFHAGAESDALVLQRAANRLRELLT